ncbi:MAG: SPOR domain-containing protein [Candidatus Accumulibacter sp.]|jgi:hypothetical protein|nr:SPOR domain-containing protein [Accumulibacter sp.]
MRVLVFLLVLANLLFFTWARGYLGGGETDGLRVATELRAEQIRIVSKDRPPEGKRADAEEAPPGKASASPVEPPPPPTAEPPREDVCVVLGEVPPSVADSLERSFAEKLPAFKLSRTVTLGNTAYWVNIPPFRTRREAESKVAELKRRGIREKEYFIMQESADSFAISLGLFSTRGAAESTLAALREKGVRSARLSERARKLSLSQIEFFGPKAQAEEMRRILGEALPQAKLGACGRTVAQ